MIIKNGRVYTSQCRFEEKEVQIAGEKIAKVREKIGNTSIQDKEDVLDATDCYVIPGLVDIHLHGCKKVDFCDGTFETIQTMAEYEASQGVTAICPTTMTFSEERLTKICQAARDYDNASGALLCGINMEGPFISLEKKGAQNPEYIHQPDAAMFYRLQKTSGNLIKLIDIAPEEKGAMEFIDEVKESVSVSVAHTTANYDTTMQAFLRGANHVSHLYNAMTGFTHREPGVVGAAAEYDHCYAEIICDGVHIHPSVVRTTFRMFGPKRLVLISDSMEATGMPDGQYELGGQKVYVKGNRATLEDRTIAGSVTNLMMCMKNAVLNMNIPMETAIACATINPACSIGVEEEMGSLEEGKLANIVVLDKNLNIKHVFIKGKEWSSK